IVVARVERFGADVNGLVAELLQIRDELLLQLEARMIRPDIDLLRQSSASPSQSPRCAAPPTGRRRDSWESPLPRQSRTRAGSCRKSPPPCCARAPSSTRSARR